MSLAAARIAPDGTAGAGPVTLKASDHAPSPLDLPEDVQFQLGQFKHLLGELQKALQAAAAQAPSPADIAAIPEPLDRARLCMCIAKAVNSLHHVYLRAYGRDPFAPATAGGVAVGRQELDRIRQYDKKLARAVHDADLRASRPVLSLDVAAASRFIDAAIPDLSEQQRRDLKRAAQAAEAKRGGPDHRKGKKPRPQEALVQDLDQERIAALQQRQQEDGDEGQGQDLVAEGAEEQAEAKDAAGKARSSNGSRSRMTGPIYLQNYANRFSKYFTIKEIVSC
ncbi:hypothetical protein VOLCADRAFT_99155 [Volvox carteri f. nagariensis]|uniref:Nuclear nucleic acid-binding protein C1D n=1 Tax=Volvox carteri f. nagariensis TaxID=3068 RepID=D8UH46_VOLCA|nr:uncharacterized protein VOLCADRAFT_99155 [Volvox carteri f. nagariensis]EFJ40940.1 hypothetical protein VOLCADRAFT_99155 [Volvox carteri f. nagariensis]|eukprot:XP_002958007.1 hypothetical protein VOLCADRAFT_99155 [Volvox carteri f. nagariensis]